MLMARYYFTRRYKIAFKFILLSCALLLGQNISIADELENHGPKAAWRSYGQNFKDMALAYCLAKAYGHDEHTVRDIASSHGILLEWTYYDLQKGPEAVTELVQQYLEQDYHHPLAAQEAPNLKFSYLKCMDLYHSDELESLMQRMVAEPTASVRF